MKRFLAIAFIVFSCVGCVPNRKYVFMQHNDVKSDKVVIDSTLRMYSPHAKDITLRAGDVLAVRFESLSPSEIDFLSARGGSMMGTPQSVVLFGELVDPNGTISYPVIGKVAVGGLTVFEVQDKLQSLASQFLQSPKVTVRVANFRVTVLGEVKKEGQVSLPNNRVSIIEVVGLAGGLADLADRSKVKLIRQLSDGQVAVQYINLLDENLINSPFYYIQQNDILIVPPLKQRPFRNYFGPNLTLFVSAMSVFLLAYNLVNK